VGWAVRQLNVARLTQKDVAGILSIAMVGYHGSCDTAEVANISVNSMEKRFGILVAVLAFVSCEWAFPALYAVDVAFSRFAAGGTYGSA
jgi:hypothetical protein